jgi:hypothetical protein
MLHDVAPAMETARERRLREDAKRALMAAVNALDIGDVDTASARACDAWDSLRTLRGRRH